MSPICQTFVQNAWRKDLCSNCFKSKEEHGCPGQESDCNIRREYGSADCKSGLTKRYVGVAGRSTMYSRNYYGKNSWNPIMLDNSNKESRLLKSPGLIKGMDSFIKLENEKNRTLNDFSCDIEMTRPKSPSISSPISKNIPRDSWIISHIIGDAREYNNNDRINIEKQHGDSSSDLGSDGSHDISGSSGNTSCSGIELRGDADCDYISLKSEPDSAHEDEPDSAHEDDPYSVLEDKPASIHEYELYSKHKNEFISSCDEESYYKHDLPYSAHTKGPIIAQEQIRFSANLEEQRGTHDYKTYSAPREETFNRVPQEEPYSAPLESTKAHVDHSKGVHLQEPYIAHEEPYSAHEGPYSAHEEPYRPSAHKEPYSAHEGPYSAHEEPYRPSAHKEPYSDHEEPYSAHEDQPYASPEAESPIQSILKINHGNSTKKPMKISISFKSEDDVIGYGGDVDYSDDDYEEDEDDDDDDDASISSSDLSPEERELKHVTESNTNFNSENENLEKDSPFNSLVSHDSKASYSQVSRQFNRSLSMDDSKLESPLESPGSKQEGKVKLKRSPPIGGVKPQIKANLSISYSSPTLGSETLNEPEDIPMKGIKPKYVSRDEEMKENNSYEEIYESKKVTSFDDISPKITSIDDISSKVTSIDDIIPKVTSIDDIIAKVTSIDDIIPKVTSIDDISAKVTSIDDISPKVSTVDNISPKEATIDIISPRTTSIDYIAPHDNVSVKGTTNSTILPKISSDTGNLLHQVFNELVSDKPTAYAPGSTVKPFNSLQPSKEAINSKDSLTNAGDSNQKLSQFNDGKATTDAYSNIYGSKYPSGYLNKNIVTRQSPKTCTSKPNVNKTISHDFNATKNYDHSVKSAQDSLLTDGSSKKLFMKNENLKSGDKRTLREIENSKENKEKVASAVIPLNIINIQRRNSFMESQLAGTVFTLDSKLIDKKSTDSVNAKEKIIDSCISSEVIAKVPASNEVVAERITPKETVETLVVKSIVDEPVGLNQISPNSITIDNKKAQSQANLNKISVLKHNDTKKILPAESSMPRLETEKSSYSKSCENIIDSSEELIGKRSCSSSSLSTFGTPMTATKAPQSSFLHSGVVRPTSDTSQVNSVIYSTPDFLKDIKTPEKESPVTAGIQKGALYASTSCLKGLPSAKPTTTPKPAMLKDKPKIPMKPGISSARLSQTQTAVSKVTPEVIYSASTVSTAHGSSFSNCINQEIINTTVTPIAEIRKPPPTNQAPLIPKASCEENVYDVPVTVGPLTSTSTSVSAPSPTSSSSGYSTTSNISQLDANEREKLANSFQENKLPPSPTLKAKAPTGECSSVTSLASTITTPSTTVNMEGSKESHYKSTFEANRNLLSANLCFSNSNINTNRNTKEVQQEKLKLNSEDVSAVATTFKKEPLSDGPQNSHATIANEATALNSKNLQTYDTQYNTQHSYVNLQPPYENHDLDSYSSFTDDFDDDDEEEEQVTNKQYTVNLVEETNGLRRTERSFSSAPMFRNSVGPVNFPSSYGSEIGLSSVSSEYITKLPAVRSHSVPRAVESGVNSKIFGKSKGESSSKFGFGKSGFFRSNSPPSMNRKSSSERGRDTTKKPNSGFSLRKLLRLGSGDKQKAVKEVKSQKDVERESQREARKLQLQIIHPLDYNTNGVEVIARPEKRSPAYDIYGSSFQEFLQHPSSPVDGSYNKSSQLTPGEPFQVNKVSPFFSEPLNLKKGEKLGKASKKNSFLKKRKKTTERKDSLKNEARPVVTYVRRPSSSSSDNNATKNLNPIITSSSDYVRCSNTATVVASAESAVIETANSNSSNSPLTMTSLGFNSEGRPRPPPPPRKTSLDTANHDVFLVPTNPPLPTFTSHDTIVPAPSLRGEADSASLSSNSSSTRPNRPPPPRRTPSAASTSRIGGCRPSAGRDNLYANLGNARASFTPCKPGRSASIRDEEKEKRRAPKPPSTQSQNECTSSSGNRIPKGPAPPTPLNSDYPAHDHDYEYISENSPDKNSNLKESCATSTLTSQKEKTIASGGRRTNTITNLSLEDQYGAVVNSNLEALSNMLDQVCKQSKNLAETKMSQSIKRWLDIKLISTYPVSCGPRLFYSAIHMNEAITVMVTPETKVEVDTLLMPYPIVSFKDDLPSSVMNIRKTTDKHLKTSGTVWVLPRMTLCSLVEFANTSQRLIQEEPAEWQRRICFFLLQFVTALKQLQAKGIEETSLGLTFVIKNTEANSNPRLLFASSNSGDDNTRGSCMSLCQCAAAATQLLLGHSQPLEAAVKGPVLVPPFTPSPHAFTTLVTILREERASSLTKAKCILEAMLFGPENLDTTVEKNLEITIHKWLDLERATVLHSLIREQSTEGVKCPLFTKFLLFFLVRTNVKSLCEALRALESPDVTNL